MSGKAADSETVRRVVVVRNQRGLHARAAARMAKLAETFDAAVTVTGRGQTVSALSIMGLMMLAAGPGTELEIAASGRQAAAAAEALAALVEQRFEEDS